MMQPLSRNKRRYYLIGLSILFFVITPALIFYANGYRFTDSFTLNRTGGLYIMTGESGVKIFVNGELYKESNTFQKNILVQDLKPGKFSVTTEKDGRHAWKKNLDVYPEMVTEARVLMLKHELETAEIFPYVDLDGVATSTAVSPKKIKYKPNPDFTDATNLFLPTKKATSTPTAKAKVASTSPEAKTSDKLVIDRISGKIVATWTGEENNTPSYFCIQNVCKKEIEIVTPSPVKKFDFLPNRGDVLAVILDDGIYAVEIDDRGAQNIQPVYKGDSLDMRVDGNLIYVKEGVKISTISF